MSLPFNQPIELDDSARRFLVALFSGQLGSELHSPEASSAAPPPVSSAEGDVPDDETEPDDVLINEWIDELYEQWNSPPPRFELDGEIDPDDFYRPLYQDDAWLDEDWRRSINDNLLIDRELTDDEIHSVTIGLRRRFPLTWAQMGVLFG